MESWTGLERRSCPSTLRVAESSRSRPGKAERLTQLMAHTASPNPPCSTATWWHEVQGSLGKGKDWGLGVSIHPNRGLDMIPNMEPKSNIAGDPISC